MRSCSTVVYDMVRAAHYPSRGVTPRHGDNVLPSIRRPSVYWQEGLILYDVWFEPPAPRPERGSYASGGSRRCCQAECVVIGMRELGMAARDAAAQQGSCGAVGGAKSASRRLLVIEDAAPAYAAAALSALQDGEYVSVRAFAARHDIMSAHEAVTEAGRQASKTDSIPAGTDSRRYRCRRRFA